MNTPTVFVVDDDASVRDAVRSLLEAAGFAVETFASAIEFLDAVDLSRKGCLLLDVRMPEMDGMQLHSRLNQVGAYLPTIILTGHGTVSMAVKALRSGAVDFVEKPFDDEDLIRRIRDAIARSINLDISPAERAAILERLSHLTDREREILEKLVEGKWVKLIASELGTSPHTVRNQRARILEKMKAESVPDLVRMAMLARFGSPP